MRRFCLLPAIFWTCGTLAAQDLSVRGTVAVVHRSGHKSGSGDVVVTISNPNPYPVTITAVQLPTNATYATGYTTSALSTTERAGKLMPAASVSVQITTDRSLRWKRSSTTRRYFGKSPAW